MKLLIVLTLAACGSAPTQVDPPSPPAGRAQRVTLGTFEAWVLEDGEFTMPNDGTVVGMGQSSQEIGDLLVAGGAPRDEIHLSIHPLLVKTDDRVLLFDTGDGDVSFATAGRLPLSLAKTGITPAQITDIFISHAHHDHTGGLAPTGTLAFPAARIHMSRPEWEAMRAEPDAAALVAVIESKVEPFEPGAQLGPVVLAVATPGHTPGHSSYLVGTGADALFVLGDVAHHSIVSVQRPSWQIQFDRDSTAAIAMREATLVSLDDSDRRVFAVHFPFPGIGHVTNGPESFVWTPESSGRP